MIICIYSIIFASFLNVCNGVRGVIYNTPPSTSNYVSLNEFIYHGDPINFGCITKDSQKEFYMTEVNGSIPHDLIDLLDNGKGLSLFFHGAANRVDSSNDLIRIFANDWFKASGNNICIVSYAYKTASFKNDLAVTAADIDKMVEERRLEYVARMARDLVLGVKNKCIESKRRLCLKHLSQVDVSGFSAGAYSASLTCQYLLRETPREKVRILVALDPIKTPLIEERLTDLFKKGDADYTQVIHTSTKLGLQKPIGDVDIYVKYQPDADLGPLNDDHLFAFFIHLATSTKRLFITADQSEKGVGKISDTFPITTKPTECLVGVYGTLKTGHRGKKFGISMKSCNSYFWVKLGIFKDPRIFYNFQASSNDSDDDDDMCTLCYERKNSVRASCGHMACNKCWNKWDNERISDNKCPYCKQDVQGVDIM